MPNRPFFDRVEFKGGGDPVSAARAVLQTGSTTTRWGLNMEDEILRRLEDGGKGRVVIGRTTNIDYLQLNQADPWRDVDGERASIKTTHPFLTDPAVRSALALLVDRAAIQGEIMGRQGETTGNFLNRRPFASPNTKWEFNPDKANAVLDAAGWKRGADGIRAKDGKRLKVLFQTVSVPVRQKMQQIVKQACGRAGIECELKAVVGSVFFSSTPATSTRRATSTPTCSCRPRSSVSLIRRRSCARSARRRSPRRRTSGAAWVHRRRGSRRFDGRTSEPVRTAACSLGRRVPHDRDGPVEDAGADRMSIAGRERRLDRRHARGDSGRVDTATTATDVCRRRRLPAASTAILGPAVVALAVEIRRAAGETPAFILPRRLRLVTTTAASAARQPGVVGRAVVTPVT